MSSRAKGPSSRTRSKSKPVKAATDPDVIDVDALQHKADPAPELQSLRAEREKLKKELRKQQVVYGDLQAYFSDVKAAVEPVSLPASAQVYVEAETDRRVESPVDTVLHWTDWHMGAVQEADEIEGINDFSPEILTYRIL